MSAEIRKRRLSRLNLVFVRSPIFWQRRQFTKVFCVSDKKALRIEQGSVHR
jgi:hypothetical protein